MRAGVESDLRVFFEFAVHINGEAIERAERWHGSQFAIRKYVLELFLRDEANFTRAQLLFERKQIEVPGARHDGHSKQAIDIHNHSLRDFFARDMGNCGRGSGGESARMTDEDVTGVVLVEKLFQSLNWHTASCSQGSTVMRSEEHTSELQSRQYLV